MKNVYFQQISAKKWGATPPSELHPTRKTTKNYTLAVQMFIIFVHHGSVGSDRTGFQSQR
jgi:hypothetical protein